MSSPIADAWAAVAAGQNARAIRLANAILGASPGHAGALACRAMARWSNGGDFDRILTDLNQAASAAPRNSAIRTNLGTVLASTGDFAGAEVAFRSALELEPANMEAFYALSQNSPLQEDDPAVARALSGYEGFPDRLKEFAGFGLAKVFDRLGAAEKAIRYCLDANGLAGRPLNEGPADRRLAELEELATGGGHSEVASSGSPDDAPIFIVGMPRSGTTLVEALLAAHPDVYGAGEVDHVLQAENEIMAHLMRERRINCGPDQALGQVPAEVFARGAAVIRERINKRAGRPFLRFTDKLPDNAVRVGLIAALFPKARVIFVHRDPRDTAVSNLFTRFERGLGFAFQPEALGRQIKRVERTMALWRDMTGIATLDVTYEALVSEPEAEARRIIAFAGLDWDPSILDFAASNRIIRTASQYQVRQPISTRSVGRWKAYAPWLGDLFRSFS